MIPIPENTIIRILPTPNEIWWVPQADIVPECPVCDDENPVLRTFVNALPIVGAWFPEIKPSRHRSARQLKKLLRKRSVPMYGEKVVLSFGSNIMKALKTL